MERDLSRKELQVTAYLLLKFPILSRTGMGEEIFYYIPIRVFGNWDRSWTQRITALL
jgi:hypothetical protein